tara:strand:- start:951 stop:1352 length:402 start_codon:yes stop_codon:yes gene_type:complete
LTLSRFIYSIDTLENLSDLKWKYRILIISDAQNEVYLKEEMNNISKYDQEIIDRDLIIFYENNENIYYNSTLVSKSIRKSIMSLTSQYQMDRKMILIGKDGGVKRVFLSSDQIHKVFDLIDTMPMRKIEMRGE